MCLFISPMEKNADIGAAILHAREKDHKIAGLMGSNSSYLKEYCQAMLPSAAEAETGIISIKGYTSNLLALECLAIFLAQARGARPPEECGNLFAVLKELPELTCKVLALEDRIIKIAHIINGSAAVFFTGRGTSYPVALSGAWKMKMLSATYCDAIAGGELRNGAFSLITSRTPTIAIAPSGSLFAKTRSDIRDIIKHGGKVIAITDAVGARTLQEITPYLLELPTAHPLLAHLINTVALQLLAHHVSQVKAQHNRQGRPAVKSVIIKRKEKILGPGAGINNPAGLDGLALV
jgi:glucosamine--fructose-6-phosphate aminotransferase (isomerizing)